MRSFAQKITPLLGCTLLLTALAHAEPISVSDISFEVTSYRGMMLVGSLPLTTAQVIVHGPKEMVISKFDFSQNVYDNIFKMARECEDHLKIQLNQLVKMGYELVEINRLGLTSDCLKSDMFSPVGKNIQKKLQDKVNELEDRVRALEEQLRMGPGNNVGNPPPYLEN